MVVCHIARLTHAHRIQKAITVPALGRVLLSTKPPIARGAHVLRIVLSVLVRTLSHQLSLVLLEVRQILANWLNRVFIVDCFIIFGGGFATVVQLIGRSFVPSIGIRKVFTKILGLTLVVSKLRISAASILLKVFHSCQLHGLLILFGYLCRSLAWVLVCDLERQDLDIFFICHADIRRCGILVIRRELRVTLGRSTLFLFELIFKEILKQLTVDLGAFAVAGTRGRLGYEFEDVVLDLIRQITWLATLSTIIMHILDPMLCLLFFTRSIGNFIHLLYRIFQSLWRFLADGHYVPIWDICFMKGRCCVSAALQGILWKKEGLLLLVLLECQLVASTVSPFLQKHRS